MPEYIDYIYWIVIILIVAAMVYWPRKSQEKQLKKMQDELKVGDKIITYSGLTGEIKKIENEQITVSTNPSQVELTVEKWAIAGIDDRK